MPPCMPHRRRLRWRWKLRVRLLAVALSCVTLALLTLSLDILLAWTPSARPDHPFPITVLLWWEPFGRRRRLGDCQRLLNISACTVSTNRTTWRDAHAILFHHRDLQDTSLLPWGHRPPQQRWIWMNFESPSHSHWLGGVEGIFNWTMSYQTDSDIFVPYGYLTPLGEEGKIRLPRKRKLVAWVVSNWNEEHARIRYYNSLRNYVDIDVYGSYGWPLVNDNLVQTVSRYKFYLAFENSQHKDYITEKLWQNALLAGAVPVVLGPSRANYEKFIPRDSFIHVDDFSSSRKLADYLKFLDKHNYMYRRYFRWKKRYKAHVTYFWDEHYCRVCQAIRAAGDQPRTVTDLVQWFDS